MIDRRLWPSTLLKGRKAMLMEPNASAVGRFPIPLGDQWRASGPGQVIRLLTRPLAWIERSIGTPRGASIYLWCGQFLSRNWAGAAVPDMSNRAHIPRRAGCDTTKKIAGLIAPAPEVIAKEFLAAEVGHFDAN